MADQLKIVVGSTEIDLLNGSDGYKLRLDGWVPQIARRNDDGSYDDVVETITLKATGTSTSDLANIITSDIEDKIEYINEHLSDPIAPDKDLVYLRWALDGQDTGINSSIRQALIHNFSYNVTNSPFFPPVSNHKAFPNLVLSVSRHPFWEDTILRGVTAGDILSSGENKSLNLPVTNRGTVNARIHRVYVWGSTSLTEYWIGFRTDKYENKDNFVPVWPFDTVSTYNDATASGGTVTWTAGDSDLLERFNISMSQVSSISPTTYRNQRGTFTVLLRARSTGTETFNVRLSDGFYTDGTDPKNTHSRVRVSGTGFKFYNLGTVTIPPMALRITSYDVNILANYHLRIEAEVASSGTGSFEATRFVLIPEDQGFLHIKGVNTGVGYTHYVVIGPDDRVSGFTLVSNSTVLKPTQLDISGFRFPRTDCNLVFAGHGTTQSLTGRVNVNIAYYPCWLGLGGV